MARKKLLEDKPEIKSASDYFAEEKVETFSSGCSVLDCALGGGWPLRRMFNIVGDKSTGKTLLMIEACAQFVRHYKGQARVVYGEAEAAFDREYAQALGMPLRNIEFLDELNDFRTVEHLERQLQKVVDRSDKLPTLFIVDSYDALSDDKELEREAGEAGGYGMAKAKMGSTLFRKMVKPLSDNNVTLGIVSQIRTNVSGYGSATTRSGGKALDFYATHIVMLQKIKMLKRTCQKIERVYGVEVRAKVDKNKISMPHREATFPLIFGYGVENVISIVNWLQEHSKLEPVFVDEADAAAFLRTLSKLGQTEYTKEEQRLIAALKVCWREVERLFLPVRTKYGEAATGEGG